MSRLPAYHSLLILCFLSLGGWGHILPAQTPSRATTDKAQKILQRNGFLLKDLRVPPEAILSGGPPKDGIPSIDRPVFVLADQADYLEEEDQVLSVSWKGETRAYPLRILDWHEIVNDEFDGQRIIVTYCPLCGSGMSFVGEVNGKSRTFGVSGLLYNSDVLMYDRETESLWSQIMASSVAGEESGTKLAFVPTRMMRWKMWKQQFGTGKVLSPETGYDRPYKEVAYAQYRSSDRVIFPLTHRRNTVPQKEWVLGIAYQGKAIAYPFRELKKLKGPLGGELGGIAYTVRFDAATRSAFVQMEEERSVQIKVLTLYWFAWYAFHPETDVYRWKKEKKKPEK